MRVIEVLSLSFSEYLLFKDEKLWKLQQELQDGNDEALVAPLQYVLDGALRKLAVECKYKRLQNPLSIPSLNNFADEEKIELRYIANINLEAEYKGVRLVPGILVDRIGR